MAKWTVIILGITGDLARKKLIPACYALFQQEAYKGSILVGAAHDVTTIDVLLETSKDYIEDFDPAIWQNFKNRAYYQLLDFNTLKDFELLAQSISKYEAQNFILHNRLCYISAPTDFYCNITKHLAQTGIIVKQTENPTHRIVYEKPFGWDLASAQSINTCIKHYFSELQVYRVDHYLTKSLVQSLMFVRFANILFQAVWNNKYIDQVQIIFNETVGIAGRGSFYDRYGALKDVMQNHMLQLLSLTAMKKPEMLNAQTIGHAKATILEATKVESLVRGQYVGYRAEKDVADNSDTETYVAMKAVVDTPEWKGVPFFLKTGKSLTEKSTEIHIVFKGLEKKVFGMPGLFESNSITLRITPHSGVAVQLNVQKSNSLHVVPIEIDFCYQCF